MFANTVPTDAPAPSRRVIPAARAACLEMLSISRAEFSRCSLRLAEIALYLAKAARLALARTLPACHWFHLLVLSACFSASVIENAVEAAISIIPGPHISYLPNRSA